jgi:hypothetical protein
MRAQLKYSVSFLSAREDDILRLNSYKGFRRPQFPGMIHPEMHKKWRIELIRMRKGELGPPISSMRI